MATTEARPLKAPFPAFGGKSAVAARVWARLGEVRNYVEPFAFSAAMLLLRPDEPQISAPAAARLWTSKNVRTAGAMASTGTTAGRTAAVAWTPKTT